MCVRPEDGDPAVRLPECLETFKDALAIVKDRDRGVHLQWAVRAKLGVVPATLTVPADSNHVLGEHPPKSRIAEQLLPWYGRHSLRGRGDGEFQRRGISAHYV